MIVSPLPTPSGNLTLPQHFKQNGYKTIGVGKIFDYRSVDNNNDEPSWSQYGNIYQNNLYGSTTGKPSFFYALPSAKDTIALLYVRKSHSKCRIIGVGAFTGEVDDCELSNLNCR